MKTINGIVVFDDEEETEILQDFLGASPKATAAELRRQIDEALSGLTFPGDVLEALKAEYLKTVRDQIPA